MNLLKVLVSKIELAWRILSCVKFSDSEIGNVTVLTNRPITLISAVYSGMVSGSLGCVLTDL